MFCSPCNKTLGHGRKSTIDYHLNVDRRQLDLGNLRKRKQIARPEMSTRMTAARREQNEGSKTLQFFYLTVLKEFIRLQ